LKTLDELLHEVGALEGDEEVMPAEDRDYFMKLVASYETKAGADEKT